jgi:hypothetical protein
MQHQRTLVHTIRKTIVITAAVAFSSIALGHSVHAVSPNGPFNCELGYHALPDDRWANCATPSTLEDCGLGAYLLPDDRWAKCAQS